MIQLKWFLGIIFTIFSGSVLADTSSTETFLWMSKDTIINVLKILALIAFIIAASMTIKPIRAFLYSIFLKFEIQIQKIIFWIKNFFQSPVFVWIFKQLLSLVRLFRFIPITLYCVVFGVLAFAISYQPGFLFSFFGETISKNIGYIAFGIGTILFIASNANKTIEARHEKLNGKVKDYAWINFPLAILIMSYGVFLHQKGVDAVGTFFYAVSIFIFWAYAFFRQLEEQPKITTTYALEITVMTALTMNSEASQFFSDVNSFLTYVAIANVATIIFLVAFHLSLEPTNNTPYKICNKKTIFTFLLSCYVMYINCTNAIEFKALTNYLFSTLWGIAIVVLLPITFPRIKEIFSGKAAFTMALIWAALAFNIDYVNQLKAHITLIDFSNFYFCLGFTLISALCGFLNFSYMEKKSQESTTHNIFITVLLLVVSVINMMAFNSITFAILVMFAILLLMFIVSEKFDWSMKPAKTISLIDLFATMIISQTIGFNEQTKYIPIISFFIFLIIWIEDWFKTFIAIEEISVIYLLTLIIISTFFMLGGDNFANNAVVTLTGSWFFISIGIFIIFLLGRMHTAIGFFAAGTILYVIAILFEKGTIKTLFNSIITVS